jgi:hypothetical protein
VNKKPVLLPRPLWQPYAKQPKVVELFDSWSSLNTHARPLKTSATQLGKRYLETITRETGYRTADSDVFEKEQTQLIRSADKRKGSRLTEWLKFTILKEEKPRK